MLKTVALRSKLFEAKCQKCKKNWRLELDVKATLQRDSKVNLLNSFHHFKKLYKFIKSWCQWQWTNYTFLQYHLLIGKATKDILVVNEEKSDDQHWHIYMLVLKNSLVLSIGLPNENEFKIEILNSTPVKVIPGG